MTSVLLVDDHPVFSESLKIALESASFRIVGIASSGLDALPLFNQFRPQVVVLDVGLPGMNGFNVCQEIHSVDPRCAVVLLTGRTDEAAVTEALQCRANAIVSKSEGVTQLIIAIQQALKGEPYVSQCMMGPILSNYRALMPETVDPLTLREREILQLVAEGQSSKEIGEKLHLSVKTVETHRSRLMEKLNIHNVASLVRYAIRQGLITP